MLIAIGSHSRRAGKSWLVCELVRSIPEARWTVVKIAGHAHGLAAGYSLEEERDPAGRHDTSRYLAAGAARAFLLRYAPDRLGDAVPALRELIAAAPNTVIESNSILKYINPDLYVFVRNEDAPEFKPSAHAWAGRAGAVVRMDDPESVAAFIARVRAASSLHW